MQTRLTSDPPAPFRLATPKEMIIHLSLSLASCVDYLLISLFRLTCQLKVRLQFSTVPKGKIHSAIKRPEICGLHTEHINTYPFPPFQKVATHPPFYTFHRNEAISTGQREAFGVNDDRLWLPTASEIYDIRKHFEAADLSSPRPGPERHADKTIQSTGSLLSLSLFPDYYIFFLVSGVAAAVMRAAVCRQRNHFRFVETKRKRNATSFTCVFAVVLLNETDEIETGTPHGDFRYEDNIKSTPPPKVERNDRPQPLAVPQRGGKEEHDDNQLLK